jgi:hypothetical protein
VILQVLRTCFHMAEAGSTPRVSSTPVQTLLPADKLSVAVTTSTVVEGPAALQRDADGVLSVAESSTLQRHWRKAANDSFDLFSGPLVRARVRCTSCVISSLCGKLAVCALLFAVKCAVALLLSLSVADQAHVP